MEEVFKAFVEKWTHPSYRPDPIPEPVVDQLEQTLQSKVPLTYRSFLTEFGPVSTILSLLSSIVEQSLTLHSLGEFFAPGLVAEQTDTWQPLGLPTDCIAFASDELGNMFCFARVPLSEDAPTDAKITFFDHDDGCVVTINESFVEWLRELAMVTNVDANK